MKHTEDNKMYCPVCQSPLEVTHQGRYQDLSEHVSNPDGEPSIKDGYQCTNVDWCEASSMKITWIEDGDCFINHHDVPSYGEALRKLKSLSVSGMEFALNSWNHHYNKGQNSIKKWKKKIEIDKYTFWIIPKEWGYKYPDYKRYNPCWYKWKIEIWRKSDEYSSVLVIPMISMIRFSISGFLSDYKSVIYDPGKINKFSLGNCLELIKNKDSRTYRKISSFLVRTFYPKKCGVIISLAKREGLM